jgi:monoamine oxidase
LKPDAGDGRSEIGAAPAPMIEAAMRQLEEIHGKLPRPLCGVFADWASGAWHAWKPHVRSWEVRARMRQPSQDLPLFVCGEAFAELNGWTEGALNNAELVMERALGLGRPSWVGSDYPFESER